MVLHARGEGVPCSFYSTSYVGYDQSRLMENLPNRLSHHGHLLLCCPSSLPFFSRIFLSVQIGSSTNQLIQCKVHECASNQHGLWSFLWALAFVFLRVSARSRASSFHASKYAKNLQKRSSSKIYVH